MSQLVVSGGQSTGGSPSGSVLPMNIQDCVFWDGWISLQPKGLSRVFSNITFQKHQFFSTQLSLWSNSHIHTLLLEKPQTNLHQKKRSWSLFGGLLKVQSLQLSESPGNQGFLTFKKYTQQINEIHQKLQCMQWVLVNRMSLILVHDNAQLHVT